MKINIFIVFVSYTPNEVKVPPIKRSAHRHEPLPLGLPALVVHVQDMLQESIKRGAHRLHPPHVALQVQPV